MSALSPRFAPELRRTFPLVMDQQAFCWGRDIYYPDGNLLRTYGFSRERPANGAPGCSRYHLTLPDAGELVLWGFGLLWTNPDGSRLLVGRKNFVLRYYAPSTLPTISDIWLLTDFPAGPPLNPEEGLCLKKALASACAWIANYEEWIHTYTTLDWRETVIAQWWKPRTPAENLPATWRHLATLTYLDPSQESNPHGS